NGMPNDAVDNCQTEWMEWTYYGDTSATNYPNYWGGFAPYNVSNDGYRFQNTLVQSEPAAVFYMRNSTVAYGQIQHPSSAGPGSFITTGNYSSYASQCFINLPFINVTHDNGARIGDWTARWFGLNKLFRNNITLPGSVPVTIYNKTIDEILAMTGFYASAGTRPNVWPTTRRFNTSTTPLGKIISSNNAKIPPLGNLAQIDVYDMCQLYQVELGAFDSGTFFQAAAPAKKRIMTKKEFNVVAAWPDIDSSGTGSGQSGFTDVSVYDEATVTGIEQGTAGAFPMYDHVQNRLQGGGLVKGDLGGCNTQGKLANGQWIQWDDQLSPLFPSNNAETNPYFWGGSSPNDNNGLSLNSARCTSKWGVQDLVGNIMEVVAEQVFCDFSGETMYLGPGSGNQATSIR
ncbi:MAG: hypothetical protein AABY86_09870, partial [Bdellovibrionota bacterium]